MTPNRHSLDDPTRRATTDPGDMLRRIRDFPAQLRDAWENVSGWKLRRGLARGANAVVVLGMGGSAIGADLVAGLLADQLPIPLIVHRGYGLPAWVGKKSIVIGSSYSGGTEETLSGWREAARRGARRLAITTGGELGTSAVEEQVPLLTFSYDSQPRAALGHSFALMLGAVWKLGLIEEPTRSLLDAATLLEEVQRPWQPEVALQYNWPKQIAAWWQRGLPVAFGAEHLSVIARRWTTQVNENAKSWALWAEMPELNHNIVVGFGHPDSVRQQARVICLRSPHYHERNSARFDITTRLMEQAGIEWGNIEPAGDDRLGELLWANLLGDYASYYLGLLYGEDPTPVEPIQFLKARLAEHPF